MLPWAVAAALAMTTAGLGYVAFRHTQEDPPRVAKLTVLPPEKGQFVTAGAATVGGCLRPSYRQQSRLLAVHARSDADGPAFRPGKLATIGEAVPVAEQVDHVSSLYGMFGVSETGVLAYITGGAIGNEQITWFDRPGIQCRTQYIDR
jgi:hypothetical protein